MVRYEFPVGEPDPRPSNKTDEKQEPEVIYIDDVFVDSDPHQSEQNKIFGSINQLERTHYPLFLRIVTFFVSLVILFALPFLALLAAGHALAAAVMLFQNEHINQRAQYYWKLLRKAMVVMLGLFIATLSPSFGLGIIVLYFVLQGEEVKNSFLNQILSQK